MRRPACSAAIVALCCSAAVCGASESANKECDALDGPAGFAATPRGPPAWGLSAMTRYLDKAAGDAWQHVLSQGVSGQVTVVFMAGICLWLLGQMAHRPRSSCALLLTWFGWVAWSIYSERLTWDAMETRTYNVYTQTHLFWMALYELIRVWVELFAPFVADLVTVSMSIWTVVPLWYKVQAAVAVTFCYLLLIAYRAAVRGATKMVATIGNAKNDAKSRAEASLRQKKKVLGDVLKEATALPVGYMIFFGSNFIPQNHQPTVVWLLLSAVPVAASVRCFRQYAAAEDEVNRQLAAMGIGSGDDDDDEDEDDNDTEDGDDDAALRLGSPGSHASRKRQQAERQPQVVEARRFLKRHMKEAKVWLSYWTCWPLLELMNRAVVLPYTPGCEELPRLAIVFLVWLQVWDGSVHLRKVLRALFRTVQSRATAFLPGGKLPEWLSASVAIGRPSLSTLTAMGGRFRAVLDCMAWAARNKVFAGCVGAVALLLVYRALFFIGGLLTAAVVWGAAADTARIVSNSKFEPNYRARLSFWVLGRLLDWLCMIPAIGTFVLLWYPVLLASLLPFGEPVLRFLCQRFEPRDDPLMAELKVCWRNVAGPGAEQRKIDRVTLRRVYESMDQGLSVPEIDAAVSKIDLDNDGRIGFSEFAASYIRAHRLVASMSEGIPSSTAAGGKPHAPASSEQAQEANAQREADSVSPASQQSANGGGEGKSGEMAEDSSNDGSEDGSVANSGPPDGE